MGSLCALERWENDYISVTDECFIGESHDTQRLQSTSSDSNQKQLRMDDLL